MAFKFTEEQLNTLDKSFIVNLFLQLQDQNDKLSGEIQELNKKMEVLIEQITLANKNRFGRSSEKMTDTSQICFMEVDGTIVFFNEAETVSDLDAEEPDILENKPARKAKAVGKKEADIKDLPVNIINHYLTDEELVAEFGKNGWKQLPDAISKRYRFIPAKVEIDEHHVGVYASKTDDRIIKADHPKAHRNKSDAFLVIKQIQAIYREEGKLNELSSKERLMQRQLVIKPLVDALFAYLKKMEPTVPTSEQLRKAYTYILNQEKYLRVILEDGEVTIDNNASERAIRGFCIGKKNWQMIDTINGAHSSAIIYSIAETAKANNLKPYDYFVYLLEEIPKHMEQKERTFLEDLLPWSKKLPEGIRKQQ